MRRSRPVLWLWLAVLATLGHVFVPLLHEHAHDHRLLESPASVATSAQAGDDEEAPQAPRTAEADHCAVCAHLAGLHLLLPDQAAPIAEPCPALAPQPATTTIRSVHVAWLLPATRAPPARSDTTV